MNQPVPTVKSVFDQAHEITSEDKRRAFLDEACAGDVLLRQQVEALLQAYDAIRSGTFLQTPAAGPGDTGPYRLGRDWPRAAASVDIPATDLPQPGERYFAQVEGPGTQIGPYKLIKELGEGGMGAVFLARQEQPLRREVALKIIKPGKDSADIVARFEAERQALSMMDHPNIARVFEAGTISPPPGIEGQGRPYFVMELVDGAPMAGFCNEKKLTVRERLELFATVCEAVQHAHAKGVIHRDIKPGNVLVALQDGKPAPKVIDFGLAKAIDRPLTDVQFSYDGDVVGTPEYMSPEQTNPRVLGVDTATDIYALGVMLYELLTGTTPLDLAKTRGSGDVYERIRTEEAPRPSDRVAGLGDRLLKVAAQRQIEPAKLGKLLRGELDWIALKAIEKDRKRRYETASAFARDVQRYLSDEPVEACPPTVGYRVGKFVRRYRTGVAAASVVGALLVVLLVGLWVTVVRERERVFQERKLRTEKEVALAKKETALSATRTSLRMTDSMIKRIVRMRTRLEDPEKEFLRNLIPVYEAFLSGEPDESEVGRVAVAETHFTLADIFALLGKYTAVDKHYSITIQLYEKLVTDFPGEPQYRNEMARGHFNRAVLFHHLDRFRDAEAAFRRSIALNDQLVSEIASESKYRSDLANGYYNLGAVLRDLKEPAKAEEAFRQAIAQRTKLVDFPSKVGHAIDLARDHHNLGNAIRDQGGKAKAEAATQPYNQAAKWLRAIDDPPKDALLIQRSLTWDRATAYGQQLRHVDAIGQWQLALKLDDGTDGPNLALFLAAEESEANLRKLPKAEEEVLYQAAVASARAIIAAKRTREYNQEERYTRRALELLKQAKSAGWFRDQERVKRLEEANEFKSLPEAEFKQFLKNLDTKPRKKD
jgi:serine/threonine protein kinase/tetratricopeptide (TPR) repeat protein